jgi:catechol 2,3-dioxygenase-like lactoylglutathione lyase family enzyme
MSILRMNHVGVVADDLEAVTGFFLDLGFERAGGGDVADAWVDEILGLDGVRIEMVMVRTPDGHSSFEIAKFHAPDDETKPDDGPAHRLGFRHIALEVDDLDATLERVRARGIELVGEIVNFENIFRMCFVRGPEGLIVELAQPLRG